MSVPDKYEFFEMNELKPEETLNLDPEEPDASSPGGDQSAGSTAASPAPNPVLRGSGRKTAVWLTALALAAVLVAGSVVVLLTVRKDKDASSMYDVAKTVFVTETDSPGIDQITEDVIGTGVLFEDCDILTGPDEGSPVAGRLSGGTDVLVYAAEGDYYRISDPGKTVVGYVLKDKVNTGDLDLGNPDAPLRIVDEESGSVVSVDVSSAPAAITGEIDPEDFPVNSSPYFIYVEKGSHTITIFGKDSNGKYTVPKVTYLTATGRTAALTPVGDFRILAKEKWHSWGRAYSPYCCKYYGSLFFHGPIYGKKNFGTLSIESVSEIGTNSSSGCLRTTAQAAYFIYQFCWIGTNVRIVNGSPLGRSADLPSYWTQYKDPATNQVPVADIGFDFDTKTMTVGESLDVSVTFTPKIATVKDCTWSTSDSSVVSIRWNDDVCKLKALSEGTAVITATSVDGGYTASFTVTVVSDVSEEVPSDPSSAELPVVSPDESAPDGDSTTESLPDSTRPTTAPTRDDTSHDG
jgi:Bacterial surface proteins containing Ig-like domains